MKNKLLWSFGAVAAMTAPVLFEQSEPALGTSVGYYSTQPLFYASGMVHAIHSKINDEPYTKYDHIRHTNYKYYLGKNNTPFRNQLMKLVADHANWAAKGTSYGEFLKEHPEYRNETNADIDAGMALIDDLPVSQAASIFSNEYK